MLYFSFKDSLAFFNSLVCCFARGKSTSTATRFFLANSANSGLEKTSLFNLMHQPHQSDPVKSSIISLFSALALACALGRSVSHCTSSAPACSSAQHATNPIAIFFILFYFCSSGMQPSRALFVQHASLLPPRRWHDLTLARPGRGSSKTCLSGRFCQVRTNEWPRKGRKRRKKQSQEWLAFRVCLCLFTAIRKELPSVVRAGLGGGA